MHESILESKIRSLTVEVTSLDSSEITNSALLRNELGVDSLTLVDLISRIEEEFAVVFPDEEVEELQSISMIAKRIESLRQ